MVCPVPSFSSAVELDYRVASSPTLRLTNREGQKVVAHFRSGATIQGVVHDFSLARGSLRIYQGLGDLVGTEIPFEEIKALFFVRSFHEGTGPRSTGDFTGVPCGRRVFVQFEDGEVVWGTAQDRAGRYGFFLGASDPADNVLEVFVVRSAVRYVVEDRVTSSTWS